MISFWVVGNADPSKTWSPHSLGALRDSPCFFTSPPRFIVHLTRFGGSPPATLKKLRILTGCRGRQPLHPIIVNIAVQYFNYALCRLKVWVDVHKKTWCRTRNSAPQYIVFNLYLRIKLRIRRSLYPCRSTDRLSSQCLSARRAPCPVRC